MNFDNNEEALEFINRLLERLHQSGHTSQGSKIELVYVASGGQHVDTQINMGKETLPKPETHNPKTLSSPPCIGRENGIGELPDELATDEAMVLWRKAQQAGYVNEHYQPLLSRTQAALLADAMAERLGIKEKWKVFESFWHRKNMYKDYYDALNQKQSLVFQDSMKVVLS